VYSPTWFAKLVVAVMKEYAVLTNRKRAIIALVHSVFFLLVAAVQLNSANIGPIWIRIHTATAAAIALASIYAIVTTVLLILTGVSRCSIERLYFGFCSTSAAVGLLRALFGDPPMHAAAVLRVLMLGLGVGTGFLILREHTEPEIAE
jgi:hypothetical protein